MPDIDHQAIHRSVAAMAFRVSEQMRSKRHEADAYRLRESEQQIQIDVSGTANRLMAWREVNVNFDETFFDAPGQRQNDNDEPQVWIGAVVDSADPVVISAHVSDWNVDDAGHITGCTVRVGVHDPNADADTNFTGRIHVTIQGLGAPKDGDEVDGEGG